MLRLKPGAYLGHCQNIYDEAFCESSERLLTLTFFYKKVPLWMFGKALIRPLITPLQILLLPKNYEPHSEIFGEKF